MERKFFLPLNVMKTVRERCEDELCNLHVFILLTNDVYRKIQCKEHKEHEHKSSHMTNHVKDFFLCMKILEKI